MAAYTRVAPNDFSDGSTLTIEQAFTNDDKDIQRIYGCLTILQNKYDLYDSELKEFKEARGGTNSYKKDGKAYGPFASVCTLSNRRNFADGKRDGNGENAYLRASGDTVTILGNSRPMCLSFAGGDTDYYYVISDDVIGWQGFGRGEYLLYIEYSPKAANISYGMLPIEYSDVWKSYKCNGPTEEPPSNPRINPGDLWYCTTTHIMKKYDDRIGKWVQTYIVPVGIHSGVESVTCLDLVV